MSAPQSNGHPTASSSTEPVAASSQSNISPSDVGWQFVPQYYNFVNKQPHRLHCFYNKRSTFVHGEEGDDVSPAHGQQEIHERIVQIGYDQAKVYINSIDSQSSAGGGIIIQVLGEMSNANKPWRKFAQTFFLAEQPNGYFVLNDIFRYLKEETDEEEEPEVEEAPIVSAAPVNQAEQAHAAAAPAAPVAVEEEEPESTPEPKVEAAAPEPEPEPEAAVPEPESEPEPVVEAPASVKEKATPEPAAPEPVEEAPAPTPAPAPAAATKSTPPSNGAPPAAAATPAAPPAAAPAAPAKPKTWASLAAGGKSWGAVAAAGNTATAAAPAAPAPAAPPAAKKAEATPAAPAPAAAAPAAPTGGRHHNVDVAMKVMTPHCFVKLPNWSTQDQASNEAVDEPTLRQIASRFGDVVKVEIVKGKACAFVEFAKVEAARKAIIASLPTHQGGEGGISHNDGKLNFETRKEKDERGPKGGRRGAPDTNRPSGGARVEGGAQRGGNTGRGRGRGRGGASNTGDRSAK